MGQLKGIGKTSRLKLGKVLYACRGIIKAKDVSQTLRVSEKKAVILLQSWEKNGWLHRIRNGIYLPIALESDSANGSIEDPFTVANELFAPCYIGGWSAVEYWSLTDQIFQTVVVVTEKHFNSRIQKISNVNFLLKMVKPNSLFGYEVEWRNGVKILISDPSKTMIDLFDDPLLGGGMVTVRDFFEKYLRSEHYDEKKLIDYALRFGNRTIFKRMGFLVEQINSNLNHLIEACRLNISKGYSQFDPSCKGTKIVTRWKLRVPS